MAHAVHWFGLPSETFIRDAIAQMAERGWDPWVATTAVKGEHELPPERIVLPQWPSPMADRIRKRLVPARRRRALSARLDYQRMLERIGPRLVHAHFGWTGIHVAPAAARLRLPWVVSLHGTDVTVDAARDLDGYREMLDAADEVTVGSEFLRDRLQQLGLTRSVTVLPPGIDLQRFPFRGPRASDGCLRMLFVGRFIECKGADCAIDALPHVRAEEPTARLTLIGDGELRISLEARAGELGVGEAVEFCGYRSHAEVSAALAAHDLLLMPSRSLPNGQAEGSGMVSKEALAVGIQLVATDVGGIAETVPPELRAELVPENEPARLAEQILSRWRRREDWPVRARLGREFVESSFDWSIVGSRLARIYDSAVRRHPESSARR